MRPRKKVLIYHPDKDISALYRYAMRVTMHVEVKVASNAAELKRPDAGFEVTVLWAKSAIEIRNIQAKAFRTLPHNSTNYDLMEGVRVGLARKSMPIRKEREVKQAAVLVTKVIAVTKEINRVERMMEIVGPRRKKVAA